MDGNLVYYYDDPPLELKEGAIGDVILPEWAVLNPQAREKWQAEQRIALFDAATPLFLGLKAERVPSPLWRDLVEPQVLSEARGLLLVMVVLREPLSLGLRGTKKAVLRGGTCAIPSLDKDASSLNHAYTLASAHYEPDRISHTGNMFTHCFFEENKAYLPLDLIRNRYEAAYERDKLLPPAKKAKK